jgi:hypothetical protein
VQSWVKLLGRDSAVSIQTRYGLNGPGIESRWGRDFASRPDLPWGPPTLLYNGNGVQLAGFGVGHPSPSSVEVNKRLELFLCSRSGPS